MHINAKLTPTNDTDYSCHIKVVELIMPLVINSLGGEDTHTHTHTHTKTHACMYIDKVILINQTHTSLWPACIWF